MKYPKTLRPYSEKPVSSDARGDSQREVPLLIDLFG